MTFQRDLAWRQIDLVHRSSIAHQFARYALGLTYEMLPQDVVHQAKRCLLDALGCSIGGYGSDGYRMCEGVAKENGGHEEATVFGSGLRTSALNATLVNGFQVRFLDFTDMGGGGHNGESVPGILAVCERERGSGHDLLISLVISYEVGARVGDSLASWQAWHREVRAGVSMPAALGRLMGLNAEQIANAIGTCACGNITLRASDTLGYAMPMRRSLRFAWVAYAAILSCMLAKKGFTGPVHVLEGENGINQVLFKGGMDFERMTDFRGWRILQTGHKYLCACSVHHGHLYATLSIVKDHDLKPEDIAAVRLKVRSADTARHTLATMYPRNSETADHSAFYLTAIAIKERSVGPDSIKPEKFTDPVILDLIERITIEADPTIPSQGYGARSGKSEIVTKDGRKFEKYIVTPHGFGDDPLTDKEIEDKFRAMASKHMDEGQIRKILDTVWNVERLDNIDKLVRLMVFRSRTQ